jgi:hypothetical protein
MRLPERSQEFSARVSRYLDVGEYEVQRSGVVLRRGERLVTVRCRDHGVAGAPERADEHRPALRLVVDDEHGRLRLGCRPGGGWVRLLR